MPNVSPHILRHTDLTGLAEAGCDIKVLQHLFGQTDVRTTMGVYNHIDSERVKRKVDKLENLHRMKKYLCRVIKRCINAIPRKYCKIRLA